jgi:isoquinoline 1-oxidoreductase subunit alpha
MNLEAGLPYPVGVKGTQLTVNGRRVTVTSPADTPLLWVLRDELGLTGTKFGCGIAQCGACTVHLNGTPTRACVVPLSAVGKGSITTIEGLAHSASGVAVQRAWVEEDVPQCGYCQSGMLMEAAALVAARRASSDAQIAEGMAGHICRCGTYVRIRAAIKRAAGES